MRRRMIRGVDGDDESALPQDFTHLSHHTQPPGFMQTGLRRIRIRIRIRDAPAVIRSHNMPIRDGEPLPPPGKRPKRKIRMVRELAVGTPDTRKSRYNSAFAVCSAGNRGRKLILDIPSTVRW